MAGSPAPRKPSHLDEHAARLLEALADQGLGRRFSIGGAVGLLHYLDYRSTHDLDAWWSDDSSVADREEVLAAATEVLNGVGEVRTRRWGDVVSVELNSEDARRFSFQIAGRAVRLENPVSAGWVDVDLDALRDLVASKMVAMVERGAPRDLRDVHAICTRGLASPSKCWQFWHDRERLADRSPDSARARVAIETHFARLEQHRPLSSIADEEERSRAAAVRRWFGEVLVRELD